MANADLSATEWFERFTIPVTESGCWLFVLRAGPRGYGQISMKGKMRFAHRVAYELVKGPIPQGMDICHTCDVRCCVNPKHLYAGTDSDNQQDALRRGRHAQAAKTHCPKGHPYNEENTERRYGERNCRECRRQHAREWKARVGYKSPSVLRAVRRQRGWVT